MNTTLLVLVGALGGLHAATWGAYKDSRFEGFAWSKFARSVVLGAVVAVPVGLLAGLRSAHDLLLAIGLCYATERLVTESWKAFLREDDQSAYTIPMRLAVKGRPVQSPVVRRVVGLVVVASLFGALELASRVDERWPGLPTVWLVVLGGVGGWLTAFGGAWKDAPVEGFQLFKFFRSPGVATVWALALAPLTTDLAVLAVAAAGLAVATIETYKTFLNGGAPGKFGDRPVRFPSVEVRATCRLVHGSLYLWLTWLATARTTEAAFPVVGPPRDDQLVAWVPTLVLTSGYGFVVLTGWAWLHVTRPVPTPEMALR